MIDLIFKIYKFLKLNIIEIQFIKILAFQ